MEQNGTYSPLEAWDDFAANVVPSLQKPIPNEILVAANARKDGAAKALGWRRVRRLLEKYAPERYGFYYCEPYFVKQE